MPWYDILGDYVTAQEVYSQFEAEAAGRTLAQWIADVGTEMFPTEPITLDEAEAAARDLLADLD